MSFQHHSVPNTLYPMEHARDAALLKVKESDREINVHN